MSVVVEFEFDSVGSFFYRFDFIIDVEVGGEW